MHYPEDRDGVRRKLKVIARHLPVFTVNDCFSGKFRMYHGKHHTDDWIECARDMVSEGKLYTNRIGKFSAKPFQGDKE